MPGTESMIKKDITMSLEAATECRGDPGVQK